MAGQPIWAMAYDGGMKEEFVGNLEFTKKTFTFLKKALSLVEEKRPFRGPDRLEEGNWLYIDESEGDVFRFKGIERILFQGKEVFRQNYIGGSIIPKK